MFTAVLYGADPAFASEPAPAAGPVVPQPASRPEVVIPHIALLLPTNSALFGRHAEAVKLGFLAAAKVQGAAPLPIRIYGATEQPAELLVAYRHAIDAGARIVVGPITRSGVTALAGSGLVSVPTLALNAPEGNVAIPPGLHLFSLQAENEARQVAQLAYHDARRNAFIVRDDTPLMKRIHDAFAEEFTRLGGTVVAEYPFTPERAGLIRLRQAAALGVADMVFLALDFPKARLVRPYLDTIALYATSQVYPGDAGPLAGYDLDGVRFVDMPWMLQPDHPAVMIYPRQDFRNDPDLDRLYALGIDAFRLAQELLAGKSDVHLDGVTGRIAAARDRQFARELTPARFRDGKALPASEPKP